MHNTQTHTFKAYIDRQAAQIAQRESFRIINDRPWRWVCVCVCGTQSGMRNISRRVVVPYASTHMGWVCDFISHHQFSAKRATPRWNRQQQRRRHNRPAPHTRSIYLALVAKSLRCVRNRYKTGRRKNKPWTGIIVIDNRILGSLLRMLVHRKQPIQHRRTFRFRTWIDDYEQISISSEMCYDQPRVQISFPQTYKKHTHTFKW